MYSIVQKLNVSALIEPLTNETVLTGYESSELTAETRAGWSPDRLAARLYQMIEHKSCQQQFRFFELVREKQPCLVTEQDIADLAKSAWNWHR